MVQHLLVSSIMADKYNYHFEQNWVIFPNKDLWSSLPEVRWWFLHVDCRHFKAYGFQLSQQIQVHKVLLAEQTCSLPATINCRSLQHKIQNYYHMFQSNCWCSRDMTSFSVGFLFSYLFNSITAHSPDYFCTFLDYLDREVGSGDTLTYCSLII